MIIVSSFIKISLFFVLVQGLCNYLLSLPCFICYVPSHFFPLIYIMYVYVFSLCFARTMYTRVRAKEGAFCFFVFLLQRPSFGLVFSFTMGLFLIIISLYESCSFFSCFLFPFLYFVCIFIVVIMLASLADK